MPRLFTGLALPDSTVQALSLLRGGVEGARWVDPENYHVTLRFVGDIADRMADDLADALSEIEVAPFIIRFSGPDTFGGDKPHALHMRVAASPELRDLQAAHERVCRSVGLPPCTRKFQPHVTLARLKRPDRDGVARFIRDHSSLAWPEIFVDQFVLYSARPGRGGGPYVVEAAYDFVSVK